MELRHRLADDLEILGSQVEGMARDAQAFFKMGLEALETSDTSLCDEVIVGGAGIHREYTTVSQAIIEVFALHAPVASDLRFLTSEFHINSHLERIGQLTANVARLVKEAEGLPRSDGVLRVLTTMGNRALEMFDVALDAVCDRDLALAATLASMDEPIDCLNRSMMGEVLAGPFEGQAMRWGASMYLASRQFERVADHLVNIGEQVVLACADRGGFSPSAAMAAPF